MLTQLFSDFNGLEIFFLFSAIVGGFFVLVKLLLQFIGTDGDTGIEISDDFDTGHGHVDSDAGFRLLSLHGLSSFFMMFGLVGLAMYRQSQTGAAVSILSAVVAGAFSVWGIGKIFQSALRLQSSGTLNTYDAVGSTGTVYLKIPAEGTGRVSINFKNRLREFDALEKNGNELLTGTPIRVVQVNANVLVVEPI